jgi:hypothetical protein
VSRSAWFVDRLARIETAFTKNPFALALAMLAADGLGQLPGDFVFDHGNRRI